MEKFKPFERKARGNKRGCEGMMVSRRDFIKKGQAVLAVGGGLALEEILSSCATITFKEEAPVIYPPLKGHKTQPPEYGCFIGIRREVYGGLNIPKGIDTFEKEFSTKPAIWALLGLELLSLEDFPWVGAMLLVKEGVIPLIYPHLGHLSFKELAKTKPTGSVVDFANHA